MIAAIIPSRLDSTRFPGKAVKDLFGKPVIQHIYEGCVGAVDEVWVATPDKEIYDIVRQFGKAVLTGRHDTMHGRVVEANEMIGADTVALVQGDEPMVTPEVVKLALGGLTQQHHITMVTRSIAYEEIHNPKNIRLVVDSHNEIKYISRENIPGVYSKAVGIKAFHADTLLRFPLLPVQPGERAEGLEELRFLLNGIRMRAVRTEQMLYCVDVKEDLEKVRSAWKK